MLGAVMSNQQASEFVLRAVGMSTHDIRTLQETRIPIWSVVLASAVVGGLVVARYAPRTWIQGFREIGQ